jgi:hypothetical protein
MPNAPVVLVLFLKSTDYEQMVPADYQGNWYTGMCLIGAKCTDADFVPRNTSIFYDAFVPQMTANQDAAVKALYATATPEFWIAAAHANGIFDKDAEFAGYAADERLDLAKKLRHQESSSEEFLHEVEIGIGLYVASVVLLCACFTRRTHKFNHSFRSRQVTRIECSEIVTRNKMLTARGLSSVWSADPGSGVPSPY